MALKYTRDLAVFTLSTVMLTHLLYRLTYKHLFLLKNENNGSHTASSYIFSNYR